MAAGDREAARECLDVALKMGQDTWIQFYDAELLRLRAHTLDDVDERNRHLREAIDLAKRQGAHIFELRAAVDYFESVGEPARATLLEAVARLPGDQPWPDLRARTSTAGVSRNHDRVAILGGGMAGLSAAWRLSEPGWRDHFDSITVYQRGWRLGGKAASSRGHNGRIEEHGLHVWLGSYDNSFGLLRECYAELDRATTDPAAPILPGIKRSSRPTASGSPSRSATNG